MRVVVTGGVGFVGANLVRALTRTVRDVVVVDDLSAGTSENLAGLDVAVHRNGIQNPTAMRRVFKGADAVVHLAALSGVAPSVKRPDRDFEVNVRGTFNVLDAARRRGVGRVIVASSGAVLAGAPSPLHERRLPHPLSPYGASKLYGEALLQSFGAAYDLGGVAFRLSNVYGPYSLHKKSVVAEFLRRALRQRPLVIHGTGRQTRDFMHVDDVVSAIEAALRTDWSGTVQLGTGVETSIVRLVSLVREVAGIPLPIDRRPARGAEASRNVADISLARSALGWEPEVALRDGLAETYAWLDEALEAGPADRRRA